MVSQCPSLCVKLGICKLEGPEHLTFCCLIAMPVEVGSGFPQRGLRGKVPFYLPEEKLDCDWKQIKHHFNLFIRLDTEMYLTGTKFPFK